MLFEKTISTLSFAKWIRTDKENKLIIPVGSLLIIIQFLIFKFLYPQPNFMPPDSYNYIGAALNNEAINIWPIGYSKFLRLFSYITNSDVTLVWFQYLLLQASLLYFLFSIRYLFSPTKWSFRLLLILSILNPLLPHISNFVSSDSIFITISLIWFTQLLWIIYQPQKILILVHSLILLLAITVRFYALFYPFITIILLFLIKMPRRVMWQGIISTITLLLIFIGNTQYEYKKKTGKIQFLPFGGWQLAANALYGYAYAPQTSPNKVPGHLKDLHTMVNLHNMKLRRFPDFLRPDYKIGVYYLWDFNSPLIVYREKIFKKDSNATYFKKWAYMGPIYREYGQYLIKQHPASFIKHYILPNLVNYFAPPPGFLGAYNLQGDTVDHIAAQWFKWRSNTVAPRFGKKEINVSAYFTVAIGIINVVFILSIGGFISLSSFKKTASYNKKIFYLTFTVWLSNMIWSVITAPIELRYQLFPMIVMFVFSWFLLSYILEQSRIKEPEHKTYRKHKLSFLKRSFLLFKSENR